jgi:hypothetical protein
VNPEKRYFSTLLFRATHEKRQQDAGREQGDLAWNEQKDGPKDRAPHFRQVMKRKMTYRTACVERRTIEY